MFKPVFVNATTIDDAWHQLLWEAKENGRYYKIDSGSYEGQERVALDFAAGFINFPHTRPLAPLLPENSPLPRPTTEEEIEAYFANYLMDIKLAKNEHYRYSSWIVGGNELCRVKQLDWIIDHLRLAPGNEHCYLVVGTPEWLLKYDEPYKECHKCRRLFNWKYSKCPYCNVDLVSYESLRKTTPCLRGLDFRIIDGYFMMHVIYRSWDLLSGFPTNMGGFTLLNEYVAGEIGVEPGPLAFSCKSLHVYSHAFDYLELRYPTKQ